MFWEYVHPDDIEQVKSAWIKTEKEKLPYSGTFRIKLKDGTIKHLKEQAEFIVDKNELNPKIERTVEITYGLRNFIGNAAKYSNSAVEVSLESNKKITEVRICDDGPGFSEDIFNILGEPYIRSDNKIISSKSGLGLGTFIGKTLLERMKASVIFGTCDKTNGALVTVKWLTKDLLTI